MAAPVVPLDAAWGARLRPQSFRMHQGDDLTLTFTVRNRDGSVKDITGAGVRWMLSDDAQSSPRVSKTVGGGITIPTGTDGKFEVTLDANDTGGLDGEFRQEAEVTESTGPSQVVAIGRIAIALSIFWQLLPAQILLGIAATADDPFGMVIEETFEVAE